MRRRSDGEVATPRRHRKIGLLASIVSLAVGTWGLAPGEAEAYCRMAACSEKKGPWTVCESSDSEDCGAPIVWKKPCVGFSLQHDASGEVPLGDAKEVFEEAFGTWTRANCSGENPSIEVEYLGTVECEETEYSTEKGNANIIVFRDEEWPHDDSSVLALTTVTYSLSSGEIFDADMEVNTADHHFTTDDDEPDIDLLSVATHEAGHFLGLAHSPDPHATMYACYSRGSVGQRSLASDDVAGICAIYSPDTPAGGECDPTPRHGFSGLCAEEQSDGGSGGHGDDEDDGGAGGTGGTGGLGTPVLRACALSGEAGDSGVSAWTGIWLLAGLIGIHRSRRGPGRG